MSYLSNKLIYLNYKYVPLAISAMFLFFSIHVIVQNEIDASVLGGSSVFLIPAIVFLIVFLKVKDYLVEVEVSNEFVKILGESREIKWLEISFIAFRWFGLYQFRVDGETFVFPPYDFGLSFFGHKLNHDEFDALIDRKKRELKI